MRIGVISDTHKMNRYIDIAKKYIEDIDVLIHLGDDSADRDRLAQGFDGEVYCVRGNCDMSNKYPKEQLLEFCGFRIFITHGDLYGVKRGLNSLYYRAKELNADIALFGHTHQHLIEEYDNIVLMNPGSISLPNFRGRYLGIIELENGNKPKCFLKEIVVE